MIKIVHITAHLGGGVGRILSSISICSKEEKQFEHIIITLENTQTPQFEDLCKENGINVILEKDCNTEAILKEADIVQIDWWHHPLTAQFINKYLNIIPCRLLVWSHISGCSYPYISPKFVEFPDEFVFTTPFSYENKHWSERERDKVKQKSQVVISSGIDFDKPVQKREHKGFNVGYIGFLSYTKTHPSFIQYCEEAAMIPDICFKVVGDTSYGKELVEDARKSLYLKDKIVFEGYSLNVKGNLAEFDVFGYPLNPQHYGTAENVLLEAMASGVVPVVLNQCTEKHLVQHMKTGLVVNSIKEYGDAMKWLYRHPKERMALSENASRIIIKEYYIYSTIQKMNQVYEKLLKKNKRVHYPIQVFGKTPYEWFSSCYIGDENNIEGIAFSETKGSIKNYLKYFPDNVGLRKVVKQNESRNKTIL